MSLRSRRFLRPACEQCGGAEKLEVHHVDRDSLAAILVSAAAIATAPEDERIGARALLIPVRDWSDGDNG